MLTFCKCRALPRTLNHTLKTVTSRMTRSAGIDVKQILLAMRITAAILLIFSLHVTAKSVSQTITLSGKDIPLKKVFAEIEKQSGYLIVSNKELVDDAKSISVNVQDYPLLQFLEETLSPHGLSFVIESKTIFLKKKPQALASAGGSSLSSSSRKDPPVTGIVRGPDGQPLAGVNVMVKGTKEGTTTDSEGKFSLEVQEGSVLEITSIGFGKREIKISSLRELNVSLEIASTTLNDVVINKGYYTENRRFSVGNVSHVDAKDIEKSPVQNVLLALQGRVTGVEINQLTGIAGGGITTRIQGRPQRFVEILPMLKTFFMRTLAEWMFSRERLLRPTRFCKTASSLN
jgi:TonB-dependent starch-binding outer membrane protein SusC